MICTTVDQALSHIAQKSRVAVGTLEINDLFVKHYKNTFKTAGFPDGPQDNVPLFLIFKFGYPQPYQGPDTFEKMVAYFKDMGDSLYRSARNMVTMEQKHKVLEQMWHTAVIVYLKDFNNMFFLRSGHVLKQDGVVFYFTQSEKIAHSLQLKEEGDFIISQPFVDRIRSTQSQFKSFRQLIKFIRVRQNKGIKSVTGQNVLSIFKVYDKVIVAFVDNLNDSQEFLSNLNIVAKEKQNPDISFVYTETHKMAAYLDQIGVSAEQSPILLKLDTKKSTRAVFDNDKHDITRVENLRRWVEDQLRDEPTGKMDAVQTQKEPEDNDTRALKVITNNNFERMTQDTAGRVALVAFTRPNCVHCISLQPVIEELSEKYSNEDNSVIVGKFDTTMNDLPKGIAVKYLPSIRLYQRCDKSKDAIVKEYPTSGTRTLESLEAFIEENKCSDSDKHDEL